MWIYDAETQKPIRRLNRMEAGALFEHLKAMGYDSDYVPSSDDEVRIDGISGEFLGYHGFIALPDLTAVEDGVTFGDEELPAQPAPAARPVPAEAHDGGRELATLWKTGSSKAVVAKLVVAPRNTRHEIAIRALRMGSLLAPGELEELITLLSADQAKEAS